MTVSRTRVAVFIGAFALFSQGAQAREPGVAPLVPPGSTLGLPIAAALPPGLYLTMQPAFYDAALVDGSGHYAGLKAEATSISFRLLWVPGWTILGASYRALAVAPLAHVEQFREVPFPPPLQGSSSKTAWGNPLVQPLDLSWPLGGGFHVSVGIGVYLPIGQWERNAPINIGANFWAIEPSVGFTYLRDGWHASLHVLYNHNWENRDLQYLSGDEVFVNATLTKSFHGVSVGPVAYYQRQVTEDRNSGGPTVFGGNTFGKPEELAVGGLISGRVGGVDLQLMYTHDIYARNTVEGGRVWFGLGLKL